MFLRMTITFEDLNCKHADYETTTRKKQDAKLSKVHGPSLFELYKE